MHWGINPLQKHQLCLMTLKINAKFEGKPISSFINTRILWILTWAFQILKVFTLHTIYTMCRIFPIFHPVYNVSPKKVQGSFPPWHWRIIQNLKKNWLVFGKWHEKYGNFSPKHLKVSKLGLWMDGFIKNKKYMSLEIYRGVMYHGNDKWGKIWRRIGWPFQKWHKEFDRFWPKHPKVSKTCTLMASFWTKYIMFELKKYRWVMFHDTEEWCKIWRKTYLWFGKWYV